MPKVFKRFKKEANLINNINYGPARKPVQSIKYPKTFDIILADVITAYKLSGDEIKVLGEKVATRSGTAKAILGHQVFLRINQMTDLFGRAPVVPVTPCRPLVLKAYGE